ncbi:MAG: glycosyltransferase family 2 protein [Candidatus Omnitrophica bacterium]|nr:glycosyltransferase family 2 protein [Candidatus Omnitrophota bacterium]
MKKKYIKHPKVSIVIPVKDALEYLCKCLISLNKYTENYELILIDNNSNAETKSFLDSLDWFDFILIKNKENRGYAYACNQGIKVASSDYICFLNSDTILSENWLGKLMKGFKADDNVGIVGPTLNPSSTVCSPQVLEIREKEEKIADQDYVNGIAEKLPEKYEAGRVVGVVWVIKQEVFNKIGVFDYKRYGIATWEDIDFLERIIFAGYKVYHAKASYVYHYGNKSTIEMGLNPIGIRKKNKPIYLKRKAELEKDNLFVENDVQLGEVKKIKGIIPILMITYNRLAYTKKAIKAILGNTKWPYRLFVWDNKSSDGTIEYLKGIKNKNIEIHYSENNVELVEPMNRFFEKFKNYKYVAKVDNDTVVSKGWLEGLKEVADYLPFFVIQADHYLMLRYNIIKNEEYYRNLVSIEFKGNKIYLALNGGGTGILIRRQVIDEPVPEKKGTLGGWVHYQNSLGRVWPSCFYSGAWVDRLDQTATNKYKEPSDYPEYDNKIAKLRNPALIGAMKIHKSHFEDIRRITGNWLKS